MCVVLENGRIAGIVTQQVMRANQRPRCFDACLEVSDNVPTCSLSLDRTVNLPFVSKSSVIKRLNGQRQFVLCNEQIARIIQLPANGMMEIRVQDLENMLLTEAQAYMARTIQKYSNDGSFKKQPTKMPTLVFHSPFVVRWNRLV